MHLQGFISELGLQRFVILSPIQILT